MNTLDKANAEAVRSVRKILVGKGKAAGNFYAIADTKNTGGLAVTMSAKDPKGSKVLTMGKSMKKEVKNGKFNRGTLVFDREQKKLIFQIASGNLSAANLVKALKNGFGSNDLKTYSQKAKVTMLDGSEPVRATPEEAAEDISGEAITDAELAGIELTAEERAELDAEQVEMSQLNAQLGAFLSLADDEKALESIVDASISEIRQLNEEGASMEQKAGALEAISSIVEYETTESPDNISPAMLLLLEEATKMQEVIPAAVLDNAAHMRTIEETKAEFLRRLKQVGERHLKAEIKKYNDFPKEEEDAIEVSRGDAVDSVYVSLKDALYARHLPGARTMDDNTWAAHFLQSVESPDTLKMVEVYHPELMRDLVRKWKDLPFDCKQNHIENCHSSWDEVKGRYIKTPIIMERFIAYRKSTVDGLLSTLRGRHKVGGKEVLLAKSVGSQNLTSDYDLTLASSDGSGIEIDAIKEFNATIKARYGKQPGTVFDTNLYAKDFLRVKDTILNPGEEDDDLAAIEMFTTLETEDQDIAALTKMCQYMSKEDWDKYTLSVTSQISDADKKRDVEKQMQEAANLLTLKRLEILKQFSSVPDVATEDDTAMWVELKGKLEAKEEEAGEDLVEAIGDCIENTGYLIAYLAEIRTIKEEIGMMKEDPSTPASELNALRAKRGERTQAYSNLMEVVLAGVEHFFDDEVLEARNDIYMDKMQLIRDIQNKHRRLDALNVDVLDEAAITAILTEGDAAQFKKSDTPMAKKEWLRLKSDSLKEQAKRMLGEANFFAAEAYLSEGPLQHIVFGNQSGNLAAMERLKPEHFLESVNEQTGDFMKDIGHHGHDSGEAFIQTAKYLSRMFEGIVKLNGKMADLSDKNFEDIPKQVGWRDAGSMKAEIEAELMPIRGAKGQYATMGDAEKYTVGKEIGARIYGSDAVPDLVSKVLAMNAKLNAMVRQEIDMRSNQIGLKYQEG